MDNQATMGESSSQTLIPFLSPVNFRVESKALPSILVNGSSDAGKTSYLQFMLYTIRHHVDLAILVSPTAGSDPIYRQMIPDVNIFSEIPDMMLEHLLKKQSSLIEETGKAPFVVLILDDLGVNREQMRLPIVEQLFTRGRHANIIVIVTTQYLRRLPTAVRSNAFVIITALENNGPTRRILFEEIFQQVGTEKAFSELMASTCTCFRLLVKINNGKVLTREGWNEIRNQNKRTVDDSTYPFFRIMYTLAPSGEWQESQQGEKILVRPGVRPFRLGKPIQWLASTMVYNPRYLITSSSGPDEWEKDFLKKREEYTLIEEIREEKQRKKKGLPVAPKSSKKPTSLQPQYKVGEISM